MPFARGKYAKAISDRSGMEFPYSEMVREWNGMLVHKSEFEAKHPQLETRSYAGDGHGLSDARPAREETNVLAILGPNPFETIAASSGIINVYEKSHGRDTSDTVRFRGPVWTSSDPDGFQNPVDFDGISGSNIAKSAGYSITVGKRDSAGDVTATDDYYYFTVDTNTATSGGVSGGGENCTAGPATLED
jgi:hypothetical protein